MIRCLAWDTSAKSGAIVALEGDPSGNIRLVAELSLNVEATHSERLLWGIHQVLESTRWNLNQIDFFGVGVGPGSFTGLRIGITTARTLAHALKKPLIPVSSLALLARSINLQNTLIIAATDACKGELFALWGSQSQLRSCVSQASEQLWSKGTRELVCAPAVLQSELQEAIRDLGAEASWIVVGEGRQRYSEMWSGLPQERELQAPLFSNQVQARVLGEMIWQAVRVGFCVDSLSVFPEYLRASDAELKLKAGLLKPSPIQ
jgi:tRNA threonylcarbamoyladenosine biosynthesis protein TsaB